jgi:hypothetical protein
MARMPLRGGDPCRGVRFRLGAGGRGAVCAGTAKDGTLAAVKVLRPGTGRRPRVPGPFPPQRGGRRHGPRRDFPAAVIPLLRARRYMLATEPTLSAAPGPERASSP